MNKKQLNSTYELIPRHRRRAFLRRCFDRLAQVVYRENVDLAEILTALRCFETVMQLAEHVKPEEKLLSAVMGANEPDPAEAREQLRAYVKREYGVDLRDLRN